MTPPVLGPKGVAMNNPTSLARVDHTAYIAAKQLPSSRLEVHPRRYGELSVEFSIVRRRRRWRRAVHVLAVSLVPCTPFSICHAFPACFPALLSLLEPCFCNHVDHSFHQGGDDCCPLHCAPRSCICTGMPTSGRRFPRSLARRHVCMILHTLALVLRG